ncbi:MAG: flavoprotein [Elusimicrobiota bacterium]|jgi:phosphopantothenoylcysteine decarboxylase/phosphopantothenate--cysteine ligase|nr:flavoprotein [Elusimicrobiota bacterium]
MKKNILFILTGSIAAYKACYAISHLVKSGHSVKTAVSKNALNFIGQATLEGLSGKTVYKDLFEKEENIEHISLSKWADITVFCPTSANVINKMAAGIGDDCATTIFLSHNFDKPCVAVPAMNEKMYTHPATKKALKTLADWGVLVMPAAIGRQACGDIGPGKMPEPEDIIKYLEPLLK